MRTFVRAILSVILCAAAAVVIPVPASAAPGDLVCIASAQANFVPPLTLSGGTVDVDITGAFSNCVSPNNNYTALQSGSITGSGDATALPGSPCSLLLTITGSATVEWSPPGTPNSKLDIAFNTNLLAGTVGISATFTHGPLAGDAITPVLVEVNPNLDCLTEGLKYIATSLSLAVIG